LAACQSLATSGFIAASSLIFCAILWRSPQKADF
jgi:hypothetical protein